MKSAFRAFMKQPTTWVGIITAFMFQIIFAVIWMTGYNGVTERVDQLRIAVINEDEQFGSQIAAQLVNGLPFDMVQMDQLEEAKKQLDHRELQMVVVIPADFSAKAAAPDSQATLQYWINESNPALIKSIVSGAATQITAEVNQQTASKGIQAMLANMSMPEDQAAAAAGGLVNRVASDVQLTNTVQGMNNQMVPMMLVLASYVGAMIMGMNLEQSVLAIRAGTGKWARFAARATINVAAAVVVSFVGSTLISLLGGQMEQGFLHLWLFQMLFLLTFMFVSQMFLYLFGMAGMLFNIILLSAQLVSSGAIVPRELLSGFYVNLGEVLPATYAVEGSMNILFGGPSVGSNVVALCAIGLAAIAISAAAVLLKPQPAVKPVAVIASNNQ